MGKTAWMTKGAASRIQSATAKRYGTVAKGSFAARAQSAAARNGAKGAVMTGGKLGLRGFAGAFAVAVAAELAVDAAGWGYRRSGLDRKVKQGAADLGLKVRRNAAVIRDKLDRNLQPDVYDAAPPTSEEGGQQPD